MYYMDAPTSYLDYPADYAVYADYCVGSGGNPDGVPNYSVGDSAGDQEGGYTTWDSSGGAFSTGTLAVSFEAFSNGTTIADTCSTSPVSLDAPSYGTIKAVQIIAGVDVPGEAQWSNVSVSFYKGDVLEETDSLGNGPHVNTSATPGSPVQEQILTVTARYSDCDHVEVSGSIKLDCPATTTPGPNDLFCDAVVIPNP